MKEGRLLIEKGTLWESIVRSTRSAIAQRAILPIPTEYAFIEDSGMRFFVRILAGLRKKDEAATKKGPDSGPAGIIDPFLPPEKDLLLGDISDTHLAVLNKFNVVKHHLLMVTRTFEEQDTLLTLADFEALWLCMAEFEGLAFYNGGREAGASQQHKHLQMVPLPLAPKGPAIPIAPLLARAPMSGIGTIPGLAFQHAFVRLDRDLLETPREAAIQTCDLYRAMLASVNMEISSGCGPARQSQPYCFLATREWLLLVPRTREFFENISFNALAFAGSLFIRDDQQLRRLRSVGPMKALRSVAVAT